MARDEGSSFGVVLGVGAIAGAVFLLTRRASAMTQGSPRERESFAPRGSAGSYEDRLRGLLLRGSQGDKWRDALARTAPSGFGDADWAAAVGRWIGIESGGDPTNVTGGKELGLLQINSAYAHELGFTQDDLNRYVAQGTSDDDRARLSWRYVGTLSGPMTNVATPDSRSRAWLAYMRHALPLLLHELADQKFLVGGPGSEGMDAAWDLYHPSARVSTYAKGGSGTVGQQLLLRFVAAADAVAGYDRSFKWLPRMVA